MADFELQVGVPRLGWLIDGDETTERTQAVLLHTGKRIELRVGWTSDQRDEYLARWFMGGATEWADDPDRQKYKYDVPKVLWFRDIDGVATLVGARVVSTRTNFAVGEGIASIHYVVLGSGFSDYRTINGLRSELAGFVDWFGHRSIHESPTYVENKLNRLELDLKSPEPTKLGRRMNLSIRPHFSTTREEAGDLRIHETALIETTTIRPKAIGDHISLHGAVRELLQVATWRNVDFETRWVYRADDPLRALDGSAHGDRWLPLRSGHARSNDRPGTDRYLFSFGDLGASGFERWTRLRSLFSRGINPLIATLDVRNSGLEGCLALSCIGLDGLGYQHALDEGLAAGKANKETHRERFLRVASVLSVHPPFDVNEWSKRAAEASNGIKHANRELPDGLTMANTLRENSLVFRLWVATQLRIDPRTVSRALSVDPMSTPYELA